VLFIGELIREFLEGIGLPLLIVGLVYMMFSGRKSK
jgi:hypothetical protein